VPAGGEVAIGVGSRGIANLAAVVAEVVAWVRQRGGRPFLVPAMGSHGGATAGGQRAVLEAYGLTPAGCGAEIRATMDVVPLPGDCPIPVFVDAAAAAAAAVVLVNRIKPHTDFTGPYESGLVKMAAIGLGNTSQATAIHARGARGLAELIGPVGRQVIARLPVTAGVALVENEHAATMHAEVIAGPEIIEREPELLAVAREHQARLPVDEVDLLVVERIGKDVSGTGMDTHVIGRRRVPGLAEPDRPRVAAIFARDLTAASHGNALGMGLADVVSRQLAAAVDRAITNENVLTSGFLARGNLPFVASSDTEAIAALQRVAAITDVAAARIMIIADTLRLSEVLASTNLAGPLAAAGYEPTGDPVPLLVDGTLACL
jgi:hypothetical protein